MLYPQHLYRYIVFVFPIVCLFVRLFVRSLIRHVRRIYDNVLVKVSQVVPVDCIYLRNHLSESIHTWTMVVLEGWHQIMTPDTRLLPLCGIGGQGLGHLQKLRPSFGLRISQSPFIRKHHSYPG